MKSTLHFELYRMPGALLGEENPLPDLHCLPDVHQDMEFDASIPPEECQHFGYGRVNGILPYPIQDGYDRNKILRDYECAILENEHLRAVFFPQFGGKLWSLYDKDRQRELLHVNPVFQPANLALRNAWTSGGVEWNFGMTGHSPFTLSPLHTAVLERRDGTPVLRMYEWERIRRVSYQIDAYLPEDSHHLFLRVRLRNTRNEEVPVYWWSNIAVEETPDTRVLAPADQAFCFDYTRKLAKKPVPMYDGKDASYTTRIDRAMDFFFDLPATQRKWEAALDGSGTGLIQTSTDLLQGRKLFLWGTSPGGKHWQEFLSVPGRGYLEIQAGLANTQMEHLPMPGGACWEWLEAYGGITADPALVHSENWQDAYHCVEKQLEQELPRELLDRELARLDEELAVETEPVKAGSGWGSLELRRLEGGSCFAGEYARFGEDTMGEEQAPWLTLLEEGTFPECKPSERPAAFLTQADWIPLLEKAIHFGESDHWHAWLNLGLMYFANGDISKAREAFQVSLDRTDNAWAKRNLAMLCQLDGDLAAASDLLLGAARQLPCIPLAVECGRLLLKAERFADCAAFCDELPKGIRSNGRMLAIRTQAAVELCDFDLALELLTQGIPVNDMREGEVLLSDLWIKLHMHRLSRQENVPEDDALRKRVLREFPVPAQLDFRMSNEK